MTQPAEQDKPEIVRQTFKSTIESVNQERRRIVSTVTTEAIDRYREVVVAKGIRLQNFRENPIVLWCHNQATPIGRCTWIKRSKATEGLVAETLFAKTEKAQEIFELYRDGFLNGWSIGAFPDFKAYSPPTPDEVRKRPELESCRYMIRACELVEYSACAIPANPDALGNALSKCVDPELRRAIEQAERWADSGIEPTTAAEKTPPPATGRIELPPLEGRSFGEAREQVRRAVAASLRRSINTPTETLDRLKGRL